MRAYQNSPSRPSHIVEMMDMRELVMSITASGFFLHEPLIVVQEGGKNVAIEGNRHIATVKPLLAHP